LNKRVQETEEMALSEVKGAFQEIKRSIDDSDNEKIMSQRALLDRLISGKEIWHGSPLYRVLYDEVQRLLGMLLEAGHQDLCLRFGRVAVCTTMFDDGEVQEPYIEQFTFAHSVGEAYAALDSISVGNLDDPVVAWWYFESALWCWRTFESYFDVGKPFKFDEQDFRMVCTKSAWKEIAVIRDRVDEDIVPVIFTKDLFQKGLRSIINSVMQYAALEGASRKRAMSRDLAGTEFELVLDGNELWVYATLENRETEKFLIQRFHEEAGGDGSGMFRFVKNLFDDEREGERRANLIYKWESASKYINRIKLPKELKQAFFGRVHGATFYFSGIRAQVMHADKLLQELRANVSS
jgi:hypothetical protein